MAAVKLSDEAFLAILEANPGLRERFVSIAMAVADSEGNLKEADAAEERIVEEMRLLGRAAMQQWAESQVEGTEREIRRQPAMHRQGKKTSLAYEIRRNCSFRAAISVRDEAHPSFHAQRESCPSGMFTTPAARDH
jgi:hypothetical protein